MNELSLCQSWLAKFDRFLRRVAPRDVAFRIDVGDVDQPLVLQPLGALEHPLQVDVERTERLGEVDLLLAA